ncbi:LamG-like jellyroll fold domain-containing protein [Phytohabitans suffuscus]|uniref:LamG-like jellyroll fold domain-containing protein n=1 Tax=Phytohabitans suffuscus TaxID=624315 RepID=A0A6F8YD73_9ACTN|nr:LamG-like jellyroll fold domain-containing protein [Phytohabitans suffuscus]BCB83928.1 hypothetical protein Psuf_012410 [Phytohabitans suffuscus]
MVGVFDAATKGMALYVNGAAGTPDAVSFSALPRLLAGRRGNMNGSGGNEFQGSIDNVQVYQRALSAADVTTLYGGGNGRTGNATARTNEIVTRYTVDDRGLTTAMEDPNGNVTDYGYDEAGSPAVTTAPSVNADTYGGTAVPIRPVSRGRLQRLRRAGRDAGPAWQRGADAGGCAGPADRYDPAGLHPARRCRADRRGEHHLYMNGTDVSSAMSGWNS